MKYISIEDLNGPLFFIRIQYVIILYEIVTNINNEIS